MPNKVKPIPEGYHTVTPYLVVSDASALLEFVKKAFDAKEEHVTRGPDGSVRHADVRIGDSRLMMGQAGGEWGAKPAMLYLYVEDADATYRRALRAGGTSEREPADQPYGDRNAGVKDPWGNSWWMATHVEDVSPAEMERRAKAVAKG